VIGTVLWCAITVSGLAWELTCRISDGRWPGLREVGSALASSLPGRVALFALWVFVGVHLFARYTVPRGWG